MVSKGFEQKLDNIVDWGQSNFCCFTEQSINKEYNYFYFTNIFSSFITSDNTLWASLTNLLEQSYWIDLHPNVLALPA